MVAGEPSDNRDEWIERVLEKIRELVLEGAMAFFIEGNLLWVFDGAEKHIANINEIKALLMIASIKVVDIKIYNKNKELTRELFSDKNEKIITDYPQMSIFITKFNPIQYEKICRAYSLEPYNDTYNIKFVLNDNTPYIYYPHNKPYRFKTLKTGKPLELVQACYGSEDMILRRKDLENHGITISNKISLRQFFKDDALLNCQNGILKPFILVGTDYIKIKPIVKVGKNELLRMLEKAEE